jgi:VRR-NUC domain
MRAGWKPSKKYWNAYGALYGTQSVDPQSLPSQPKKKPPQRSLQATEAQEQVRAATWLFKKDILFYHVPNGGRRDYLEGAKFKRMGVKAGVPDICIPLPRKGYHGLYIELKRAKGGSLSESQQEWRDALTREGYCWYEAKGADELIAFVENYLAC